MVILLVNNGDKNNDFYRNMLADFVQVDGIISVNSISSAISFVKKHLAELGGFIDLIVSNYSFPGSNESAYDLKVWLNRAGATYFNRALNLSRIPMVLMHTDSSFSETDKLLGLDSVLRLNEIYRNSRRMGYVISRAVSGWVDDLLADYDLINADPKAPFISMPLFWNFACKILSRDYVKYPIRLPFLTFQRDIEEAEKAINNFYNQIEKISRSSKSRQERKYHATLQQHPEFLTGDVYDSSRLMHEQNFIKNDNLNKAFEQPDFVMVHKFHKFNKISNIVEVKLPQEKFITSKRNAFSSVLMNSFTQVSDYGEYFDDSRNSDEISSILGFKPIVKKSLLFGRSSERDIHMEVLDKRIRRFNLTDIELITYDDLITRREQLLNCQMLYHVC